MINNTKEKIWKEALTLFSKYGYDGVSVKKIADAVGIKDSSLYKHFHSKQEIFDCVVANVTAITNAQYAQFSLPIGDSIDETYMKIDKQTLENLLFNMFFFYLEDDTVSKFRKMLTIEQYKNSTIASLYHSYFIDGVIQHETKLFQNFIDHKFFINGNPEIMALHFYSPLFLLLYKYDHINYTKKEIKQILSELLANFSNMYVKQ